MFRIMSVVFKSMQIFNSIYTFKLLTNIYIYVFMAETFEIMFPCGSLSCIYFAPEMKDSHT